MLAHFAITQQGEFHRKLKSPCQDFSDSRRIFAANGKHYVLAVIADGLGTCAYSQLGAQTVTESIIQQLQESLVNVDFQISDHNLQVLLKYAFQIALKQVARRAEQKNLTIAELDCTATAAIYDGTRVWFGHVGDGGIVAVYVNGDVELITQRHKGKHAESVVPLRCIEFWNFDSTCRPVASLALMTDGLLNFCVDDETMHNRVYFPFVQPVLANPLFSDEQVEICQREWQYYLAQSSNICNSVRQAVNDDITLVVLQNPIRVKMLSDKVLFNWTRWEQDSIQREKQLEAVLYAEYREYKKRTGS